MRKFLPQLGLLTAIRVLLNTAFRMAYPFLGVFSRALGVDVSVLSLAVSSRAFVGMASPLVAPISDLVGRKLGMIIGVVVFTLAGIALVVAPSVSTFTLFLMLGVLGKYIFDPTVLAYLGDKVPYSRRGLVVSINEMGWSGAFILGIPAAAYLISRFGWMSPIYLFIVLGIVAIIALVVLIPKTDHGVRLARPDLGMIGTTLRKPEVLFALGIGLWSTAGNEIVNLIFGVWLEDTFAVKLAALAAASAIIGIAELGGEGLVALFTDKIGIPVALGVGLISCSIAAIALPLLAGSQTGALVGLFFFYISFEFVIVSHLPLMTEVMPEARATAMSLNLMSFSIGRALGAFLAPQVYGYLGFGAVTAVSVSFNMVAITSLFLYAQIGRAHV